MAKSTAGDEKPPRTQSTNGTAAAPAPRGRKATTSAGAPAPADPPAVKAAATSPRARKAAAEKKVEAAKKPVAKKGAKTGARGFVRTPRGPDLRADLRAFVTARPAGWGHEDWIAFLDHLRERGHDTTDSEAIGMLLEGERLGATLEAVAGMGARRVQAVVDRFHTLWSASHADVDALAELPGMNRALAEKVRQALQS